MKDMDIRYKFESNCFWHDFEINICQEKFNDNKGKLSEAVIRKKTNNTMAKWKRQTIQWPNEKTTIYKTLHRKLKIDQHESL